METKRFAFLSGIAILLVLCMYAWFISIGPWRSRGYTSDYYARLATSFRHGQLALEEKPDPALLALPNPYDHKARKNIPVVGDASLYEGKYYLYFGPFPSLPLAAIASILPIKPGDQFFVYLFLVGLFLLQVMLFREMLGCFFPGVPGWTLPMAILVLGLTGPYLRMLAHPFIHEAAIAGGQFLFMAGLYAAFMALKSQPLRPAALLLASLLWIASVATRTTLLVPVAYVFLLSWLFVLIEHRKTRAEGTLATPTLALLVPLLAGGAALAWYNWARFDSIFEFGLYYQLAAFNLQANYSILFSRVYVLQNIYNYFFNPFELTGALPFGYPLAGSEKSLFPGIHLPNLYAVEGKFPGAVLSTPFLLYAVIPVTALVVKYARFLKPGSSREGWFSFRDWTILALLGAFIAGAIPTLLLFYVGFRYQTDFLPCLSLLALFGFCQGYLLLKSTSTRRVYTAAGIMLAVFSVLANLALAYTGVKG